MASMRISLRLQSILHAIPLGCKVLADIGTDHGFLPIEAALIGLCEKAIACDINAGPLESAARNIEAFKEDLTRPVETRLGNGLAPLRENEADCVVIAGMGGKLIMEILCASPEKIANATLILQPQHDLEELRRFLHANKRTIKEVLVRESSRFYIILTAEVARGEITPWSDAEYFIGKISGEHALLYLRETHRKIAGYIHSITDEHDKTLAQTRLAWIEQRLKD